MTQHALPPDNDRDFRQLTGAFDRPVAPSPAFAERLKQQIAQSGAEKGAPAVQASSPTRLHATRMTVGQVIPMPDPGRRLVRILEAVAAAILILGLMGAGFFINRNGNDLNDNPIRLAALTGTPVASPGVNTQPEPARGGSFGTTADLNATYPDAALPNGPLAPSWGHVVSAPKWVMPYGDVVAALGTSELIALDASTGEELWSKPVSDAFADRLNPGATSSDLVLALQAGPFALPWISGDTLYLATPSELVGFDLRSGQEVFRASHGIESGQGFQKAGRLPANLAIEGETAYISTLPQFQNPSPVSASTPEVQQTLITAMDLSTGDARWTVSQDSNVYYPLAVSDGYLLFTTTANDEPRFVALKTTDGSVAWATADAIESESLSTRDALNFFIADSTIIETRTSSSANADPEGAKPEDALRIAAYDLESGDVLWTSRSDDPSWGLDPAAIGYCGFFPRTSNDQVLVPCGAPDGVSTLVAFDTRGDGTPGLLPEWGIDGQFTSGVLAGNTEWIVGIDGTLVRHNARTGETSELGTMGGNVCTSRSLPTPTGFVCITTDDLGTYTIQAFGPAAEATPTALTESPAIFSDPGLTGRVSADTPVIGDDILVSDASDPKNVMLGHWLVVGDTLFTTTGPDEPYLKARDLVSGDILWTRDSDSLRPLVADDAHLYIVTPPEEESGDIQLLALDIVTGDVDWTVPITQHGQNLLNYFGGGGPLIVGNLLLLASDDGTALALDRKTGDLVWDYPAAPPHATPAPGQNSSLSYTSIAANDTATYVATNGNELVKLDTATGNEITNAHLDVLDDIAPRATFLHLSGDRVALISYGDTSSFEPATTLSIYDADSLDLIASHNLESPDNQSILVSAALTNDTIYVANKGQEGLSMQVRAFSLSDGAERPPVLTLEGQGEMNLSLAGTTLFVTESYTRNQVIAIDTVTGDTTMWKLNPDQKPYQRGGALGPVLVWNGAPLLVRGSDSLQSLPLYPPHGEFDATPIASPENETGAFHPDYQSTGQLTVNLRWGPGIRYDVAATVSPGTSLQYLGESEPTQHPEEDGLTDGQEWMKVRTGSGDEGWIREVDVNEYTP